MQNLETAYVRVHFFIKKLRCQTKLSFSLCNLKNVLYEGHLNYDITG